MVKCFHYVYQSLSGHKRAVDNSRTRESWANKTLGELEKTIFSKDITFDKLQTKKYSNQTRKSLHTM